jgi:ATP-binding cassette, subfamily B (MDR/TAP), member 1
MLHSRLKCTSRSFVPDISRAIHAFRSITSWELRSPRVEMLAVSKAYRGPDNVEGDITFKACSMQYAERDTLALADVSLHVKAGQTVAFCGPSGGGIFQLAICIISITDIDALFVGKSTILSLINRFYDPISGVIEVDGVDIRAIPLEEYRSVLSLVSQDAVLYEGTFRENILLGWSGGNPVTDAELEEACRKAHILDFIKGLPDGFDTSVGYKGSQMSGGQRQVGLLVCLVTKHIPEANDRESVLLELFSGTLKSSW